MLTKLLFTLEIKFVLKIESNSFGFNGFFYYKTNREAKEAYEAARALRKRLEHSRHLVFLSTLLSCSSRFLRVLQQNRAQSRLLYFF